MTQVQPQIGRRRGGRLRLGLQGTLDLVTGRRHCVVIDLSLTGARLHLSNPPRVGEWGLLDLHRLDAFGKVVWRGDDACGLHFDAPLSQEDLLDFRHEREQLLAEQNSRPIEQARSWVEGR